MQAKQDRDTGREKILPAAGMHRGAEFTPSARRGTPDGKDNCIKTAAGEGKTVDFRFFVCYTVRMNRRNYQKELERITEKLGSDRPRLLLHSCCGPCSSSVLETLTRHFDVTLLWYNPNIYPQSEFDRRLEAQKELLERMGLADAVKILFVPRESAEYYECVKGLENEPEGGRRCRECFRLRLRRCAKLAAENGFDWFCSTLTVSRHKNTVLINTVGEEAASVFGVRWLPSDFKKRGGENRSAELSEKYGIYRQLYCGCEFSLRRREEGAERKTDENKS